ncbi:nuclear transport factor 2 family protein [Streptomyces sp. NPDC002573]|uniref:nuclear transport factor 2 family protein n=1 Tax=Streptomyces sp. NPDC002573 TaxID=3364651 RepID=UPI00367D9E4B
MDAVERLSIIEAVRRVMARYVRHADHQQWQELASLFTPDGTFTPYQLDGSAWVRMEGREQIVAAVGAAGGPGTVLIHHLFSDEIDVESPTSARGIWAMEDIITKPENAEVSEAFPFKAMHGFGHYHARFVKVDGSWFIAELELPRLRLDFTS